MLPPAFIPERRIPSSDGFPLQGRRLHEPPSTPNKTADLTPRAIVSGPSTNPVIIHAMVTVCFFLLPALIFIVWFTGSHTIH